MTFKQIQDDTLERVTFDSSLGAGATPRVRIKRFINEVYRRTLRAIGLGRYLTGTTTIVQVIGTASYAVTASKIKTIYDTNNGRVLTEVTLDQIRAADPLTTVTGIPEVYAVEKTGATTLTVRLYPTPSTTETLNVDTLTAITELSLDADVPVLHEDFHYLLGTGARMLEYERLEDLDRYRLAKAEYAEGLRDLRFYMAKSGKKATLAGTALKRSSRYGAWFTE